MLRSLATWITLAGVAGLALAAGVDALRQHDPVEPSGSRVPALQPVPPLREQLEAAGVRGVLVYADERCRRHALGLPLLEPMQVPESGGRPVRSAGTAEPGCAIPSPSHPPYPPTVVERGRVIQLVPCGRETVCRRVLLSRREFARAAAPYPAPPEEQPFVARQIAWLSENRLAVVVSGGYPDFIAVFRGRRFLFRAFTGFQPGAIRASPLGRYLVVDDGGPQIMRMGKAPRTVPIPAGLTTVHAVTFSPGERWLVLATRASVWLMELEEPGPRLIRVPLEARELAWLAYG